MNATLLLLAAGKSQRMGVAKASLRWQGRPLMAHILDTAIQVGAGPLLVVIGASSPGDDHRLHLPAAVELLRGTPFAEQVNFIVGKPDGYPIDSIRAGLRRAPRDRPLLLWPIDSPFATADLVRQLIAAAQLRPDAIAVPTCERGGKRHRGHPVVFAPGVITELLSAHADAGANRLLRSDPERVIEITTNDARVIATLNTPAQAIALGCSGAHA